MSGVDIDPNLFNSLMTSPSFAQSLLRTPSVLQSNYYQIESTLPDINASSSGNLESSATNDRLFSALSSQDPTTKVHPRSHYSPSISSKFFNSLVTPSEPLLYIDPSSGLHPVSAAHQQPAVSSISPLDGSVDALIYNQSQSNSSPVKISGSRSHSLSQLHPPLLRQASQIPSLTNNANGVIPGSSYALSTTHLDTLLLDVTDNFNYSTFQDSILPAPSAYTTTWRTTSSIRLAPLNSLAPFSRVLSIWNDPPAQYEDQPSFLYFPTNDATFSPFKAPSGTSIAEDPLDIVSLSLQVLLLQMQPGLLFNLPPNDLQQQPLGTPLVLQPYIYGHPGSSGPPGTHRPTSASFSDSLSSLPIRPTNIYLKKVSNTQSFIPTLYHTRSGNPTTILVQITQQLLAKATAEVMQHLRVSQHSHDSISSIPKDVHDHIHNCDDTQTMDFNKSSNSVDLENSNLSTSLDNSMSARNLELSSLNVVNLTLASTRLSSRLSSNLSQSNIVISLPKRIGSCEVQNEFNHYILSEENMKKPYHEDYCLTFYKRNSHGYMFVKEPTTSLKVNSNGVGSKLWVQLKVNLPRFEASSRKLKIDVRELSNWWPATSNSSKPKRLRKRDQLGDGQRRKKPLSRHKS